MSHQIFEGYTEQKEEYKQASNCMLDSFLADYAEQKCEDPVGSMQQRAFNKEHLK